MSTSYRILSPRSHVTTNRIWRWFENGDIKAIYKNDRDGNPKKITKKSQLNKDITILFDKNYVEMSRTGIRTWHSFTRWGGNKIMGFIDFIEAVTDGTVVDEHDEEYWK